MASRFSFFFFPISAALLCLRALPSSAEPARTSIPAIIVFGDSTVDTGNNNFVKTVLRSNFRPYGRDFIAGKPTGRFCNGRLATDFMAEALGLGEEVPAYLDPARSIQDFAKAVCFASAGTGMDNATAGVLVLESTSPDFSNFSCNSGEPTDLAGADTSRRSRRSLLLLLSLYFFKAHFCTEHPNALQLFKTAPQRSILKQFYPDSSFSIRQSCPKQTL